MLSFEMTGQDKVNALLAIAFAPQAARSLSRAAGTAKTAMVRAIANDMGARQTDIKRYIFTENATASSLVARVTPKGAAGIPLIKLGATGPNPSRGQGGISVKLAGDFSHAFITTMKSGHVGVFQRKGQKRLPIKELRSAPIPDEFRKFRDVGVAVAVVALRTNLVADLKYALGKGA